MLNLWGSFVEDCQASGGTTYIIKHCSGVAIGDNNSISLTSATQGSQKCKGKNKSTTLHLT